MNIVPIPAFSDNYIWMLERDVRVAVVDPGDANPVLAVLTERGVTLDTIIITHHHFDHTGGVKTLKAETNCRVVGPDNPKIEGIDEKLVDGDVAHVLGYDFDVLEVPGHTLDHIALHCADESVLFCGDTLFVGGCGRVFEGTFTMILDSLAILAALPPETAVYCTNEYSLDNLAFAQKVEPQNVQLLALIVVCEQLRAEEVPTVPSTIGRELNINPFLRWDSPTVAAQLSNEGRYAGQSPAEIFGAVRSWKDEG